MMGKTTMAGLTRQWPLVAFCVSAAMLLAAHGFETFGKMPPCALCLHQREAYWAAIAICVLALVGLRGRSDLLAARAFNLLLAFAFGAGAMVAGFHVGVEQKWWPGLATCASGAATGVPQDLLGALAKSMEVPACDVIAWSFLGLSMAAWNLLISLCLAAMSVFAIAHAGKEPSHDGHGNAC